MSTVTVTNNRGFAEKFDQAQVEHCKTISDAASADPTVPFYCEDLICHCGEKPPYTDATCQSIAGLIAATKGKATLNNCTSGVYTNGQHPFVGLSKAGYNYCKSGAGELISGLETDVAVTPACRPYLCACASFDGPVNGTECESMKTPQSGECVFTMTAIPMIETDAAKPPIVDTCTIKGPKISKLNQAPWGEGTYTGATCFFTGGSESTIMPLSFQLIDDGNMEPVAPPSRFNCGDPDCHLRKVTGDKKALRDLTCNKLEKVLNDMLDEHNARYKAYDDAVKNLAEVATSCPSSENCEAQKPLEAAVAKALKECQSASSEIECHDAGTCVPCAKRLTRKCQLSNYADYHGWTAPSGAPQGIKGYPSIRTQTDIDDVVKRLQPIPVYGVDNQGVSHKFVQTQPNANVDLETLKEARKVCAELDSLPANGGSAATATATATSASAASSTSPNWWLLFLMFLVLVLIIAAISFLLRSRNARRRN